MDIKFHITKIIDSGSGVEDWTNFIDQLKQKKCDRDLLLQVYTIALNNIPEKKGKQYKMLLVGLANLQSEVSIETARKTFEDAYGLDSDCAVVCVYLAQFEHHHNTSGNAFRILRVGKCDGRVPKFLIKNAYQNLKENKSNLFDGVPDPWDESLHDITDTSTTANKKATTTMMFGTKGTMETNGTAMKQRSCVSASSLLKEATPKSPNKEVKEKLGLIEFSEFNCKDLKDNVFLARPQRVQKTVDVDEDENYGPTLSPFMNVKTTPLIKKRSFEFTGTTPNGFFLDLQSSDVKKNKRPCLAKNILGNADDEKKEIVVDLEYSLKKSVTNNCQTTNSKNTTREAMFFEPEKISMKQGLVKEKYLSFTEENLDCNNDVKTVSNLIDPEKIMRGLPNKYDSIGLHKIPLKEIISREEKNSKQHQTPKASLLPRKPLTDIKSQPKNNVPPSSIQFNRYQKNYTVRENSESAMIPMQSGLTEIIKSINLLKDPQSTTKMSNTKSNASRSLHLTKNTTQAITNNKSSCSRGLFQSSQVLGDKLQQKLNSTDNTLKLSDQRKSTKSFVPINKIDTSRKNIDSRSSNEGRLLSPSNNDKELVSQQQHNMKDNNTPDGNDTLDAPSTENLNSMKEKVHSNCNVSKSSSVVNPTKPSNNNKRMPIQVVSESKVDNEPPKSKETTAINGKIIYTQDVPCLSRLSQNLESRSHAAYSDQDSKSSDDQKKSDVDINKIVESGLKTLGRNGFNVNPQLQPLQQQQSSKTFLLNGKSYEQIKCIGKGGSGKVFDVVDSSSGHHYALKRVKLEDLDDFMVHCYMNEIQLLTKMKNSPCIIQLLDWEKTKDHLLVLMEKGDSDFAYVLRSYQKVPMEKIKEYWQQLLQAVQVIHRLGIVHADLKPANFLFVGSSLKLIDFGISNSLQANKTSVTREYQMGTLNYMPPEALMGCDASSESTPRISRASDVWSLGCMLYLMVYKKTPYQHEKNHHMKMVAIQQGYDIKFNGIDDPHLLDCLQGCLKHNKRDRYTIDQLLLHPFLRN